MKSAPASCRQMMSASPSPVRSSAVPESALPPMPRPRGLGCLDGDPPAGRAELGVNGVGDAEEGRLVPLGLDVAQDGNGDGEAGGAWREGRRPRREAVVEVRDRGPLAAIARTTRFG